MIGERISVMERKKKEHACLSRFWKADFHLSALWICLLTLNLTEPMTRYTETDTLNLCEVHQDTWLAPWGLKLPDHDVVPHYWLLSLATVTLLFCIILFSCYLVNILLQTFYKKVVCQSFLLLNCHHMPEKKALFLVFAPKQHVKL